jgi:hypothetical protein
MKDDRILPITRIVAALVIPFLWVAFFIVFFFPGSTGEHFAFPISPPITSLYIGAGYLGGSWLFINTLFGKRWHRVQAGYLPVAAFTWFMLIDTFLHWDRFSHGRLGFAVWLILYIITPILIPALWFYNKQTDSGAPEASDLVVAPAMVWTFRLVGMISLATVLAGFFFPEFLIRIWPWTLSTLSARLMCGWIALLGLGALLLAADRRWSAWRVPLESIFIWHGLVLVAMFLKASDFTTSLINWYTISIGVLVIGILVYYPFMEIQRRQVEALKSKRSLTI